VQDWDRGVVIGRRTFGKGLVQEQYDMTDGAALRLTVAKYYTPSGRCIQRSFAKGKEAYTEDFVKRFENGELTGKNSFTSDDTTRYYTSLRRVVYGGGGIKPDIYVPYDTSRLTPGLLNMLFSDDVKNIVWQYFIVHRNDLRKYKSISEYIQKFNGDDLVNLYVAGLDKYMKKPTQKVLANRNNHIYFSLQMKAQLARILFHNNGYYALNTQVDNVVQKALQILKDRSYLAIIGR
jgi:carboxyl-terminal processing protease